MICLAAALAATAAATVSAQSFPSKPIRLVVPFPPGPIDVLARIYAPKMSEELGQAVIVENRPGAGSALGTEFVARSAPDGYTLLHCSTSALLMAPFTVKAVTYNALKDFSLISQMMETPYYLLLNSAVPINSVQELIDFAKRNPGKLSYATSGVGSAGHMEVEALKSILGIDIVHVPYKGMAPAIQDVIAGRVEMASMVYLGFGAMLASGKLKLIAVTDFTRHKSFPAVPSITETVPNFRRIPTWQALVGPAGIPRPVVMRLHNAIVKALNMPEVRAKIEGEAKSVIIGNTPEEFAPVLKADYEHVGRLVKELGIKAE